mmetsp:Transcript_120086/g.383338  ORF Transcript_120086/g.383338 Transcript_120086/m.383338 type:complete len:703 (-) Transcript_120086:70-2178(-)
MARRPSHGACRDRDVHRRGSKHLDPTAQVLAEHLVGLGLLRKGQAQARRALQQLRHARRAVLIDPRTDAGDVALNYICLRHQRRDRSIAWPAVVASICVEIHVRRASLAAVLVCHLLEVSLLGTLCTLDERSRSPGRCGSQVDEGLSPLVQKHALASLLQRALRGGVHTRQRPQQVGDGGGVELADRGLDAELLADAVVEDHEDLVPNVALQEHPGLAQLRNGFQPLQQPPLLVLVEERPDGPDRGRLTRTTVRHACRPRCVGDGDVGVHSDGVRRPLGGLRLDLASHQVSLLLAGYEHTEQPDVFRRRLQQGRPRRLRQRALKLLPTVVGVRNGEPGHYQRRLRRQALALETPARGGGRSAGVAAGHDHHLRLAEASALQALLQISVGQHVGLRIEQGRSCWRPHCSLHGAPIARVVEGRPGQLQGQRHQAAGARGGAAQGHLRIRVKLAAAVGQDDATSLADWAQLRVFHTALGLDAASRLARVRGDDGLHHGFGLLSVPHVGRYGHPATLHVVLEHCLDQHELRFRFVADQLLVLLQPHHHALFRERALILQGDLQSESELVRPIAFLHNGFVLQRRWQHLFVFGCLRVAHVRRGDADDTVQPRGRHRVGCRGVVTLGRRDVVVLGRGHRRRGRAEFAEASGSVGQEEAGHLHRCSRLRAREEPTTTTTQLGRRAALRSAEGSTSESWACGRRSEEAHR